MNVIVTSECATQSVSATQGSEEDRGNQTTFLEEMGLKFSWTFTGGSGVKTGKEMGIFTDTIERSPTWLRQGLWQVR